MSIAEPVWAESVRVIHSPMYVLSDINTQAAGGSEDSENTQEERGRERELHVKDSIKKG